MRSIKPPMTAARLERALDRLAVIIDEDPAISDALLPMYQLLDDTLEQMRAQETNLDRVRARARRLKDQKAAQSA